jgi:hypothetical protein
MEWVWEWWRLVLSAACQLQLRFPQKAQGVPSNNWDPALLPDAMLCIKVLIAGKESQCGFDLEDAGWNSQAVFAEPRYG